MKKSLLSLIIICSQLNISFAQSNLRLETDNFKNAEQMQIADAYEEVKDFTKIDNIFSKARGYTIFSSITNVNNRSLRKLKQEASMKGATHILIHTISNESVYFSKVVSYHASIYRDYSLDASALQSLLDNNNYYFNFTRSYDRNEFGSSDKMASEPKPRLRGYDKVKEEGGKLFLTHSSIADLESTNNNYQVIDFSDSYLILLSTETKNRKYVLNILQNQIK